MRLGACPASSSFIVEPPTARGEPAFVALGAERYRCTRLPIAQGVGQQVVEQLQYLARVGGDGRQAILDAADKLRTPLRRIAPDPDQCLLDQRLDPHRLGRLDEPFGLDPRQRDEILDDPLHPPRAHGSRSGWRSQRR